MTQGRAGRSGGSPRTVEQAGAGADPGQDLRDQEAGSRDQGQDPAPGRDLGRSLSRDLGQVHDLEVAARHEASQEAGAGVAAGADLGPDQALDPRQNPNPDPNPDPNPSLRHQSSEVKVLVTILFLKIRT